MNALAAYQAYAETTIVSSDPLDLTLMLYRGAIEAIQRAENAVETSDIRERAHQVARAQQIVAELASSLDANKAPDLTAQLGRLYEYVLHLLQTGNFEQRSAPLAEARKVLEALLEAWAECASQ